MSGDILPGERKSHHEPDQSVFSVIQQSTGLATNLVLARQMYPGQSEKFLSTNRMATFKPSGYLLIDLKPDTPNDKRLWPNVFEQTNKAPTTCEQPYFYYSEQKAGGSLEEQTDPKSHLNLETLNSHTL